jgi:hypothetical protein
VLVNFVVMNI